MDIVERLRLRIHTSEDETALTNEAANEIERLREALQLIANHPVEQSGQWEVGAKEMQKLARAALKEGD